MARKVKMTTAAFSRFCGYKTQNSVLIAIKKGYLDGYVIEENGDVKIIDPEDARANWLARGKNKVKERGNNIEVPEGNNSDVTEINEDNLHQFTTDDVSKLERYYKAKKAEFEFKRLEGTLVEKAEVQKHLGTFMSEIRSAFEAIPLQVVDDVRSSETRKEGLAILRNKINQVLTKLSS